MCDVFFFCNFYSRVGLTLFRSFASFILFFICNRLLCQIRSDEYEIIYRKNIWMSVQWIRLKKWDSFFFEYVQKLYLNTDTVKRKKTRSSDLITKFSASGRQIFVFEMPYWLSKFQFRNTDSEYCKNMGPIIQG